MGLYTNIHVLCLLHTNAQQAVHEPAVQVHHYSWIIGCLNEQTCIEYVVGVPISYVLLSDWVIIRGEAYSSRVPSAYYSLTQFYLNEALHYKSGIHCDFGAKSGCSMEGPQNQPNRGHPQHRACGRNHDTSDHNSYSIEQAAQSLLVCQLCKFVFYISTAKSTAKN